MYWSLGAAASSSKKVDSLRASDVAVVYGTPHQLTLGWVQGGYVFEM